MDRVTVLSHPHGFEVRHALAVPDLVKDLLFLIFLSGRQQKPHRFSNRLFRRIAVNTFRTGVPGLDRSGQIFADNRILGGLDKGGKPGVGLLEALPPGNITRNGQCTHHSASVTNR